jgi:GNAT superfamily N-acetyltransferase
MDVFVLPDFRGQGHSRHLLEVIKIILICKTYAASYWSVARHVACMKNLVSAHRQHQKILWKFIGPIFIADIDR